MKPISPDEFYQNTIEDGYVPFPHDPEELSRVPPDGVSTTFGRLPTDVPGWDNLPVILAQGAHQHSRGFGITHVLEHGNEMAKYGFESVQHFVSFVLAQIDEIRLEASGRLALYRNGDSVVRCDCQMMIELRTAERYYSVVTGYTPRRGKARAGKQVWKKEN